MSSPRSSQGGRSQAETDTPDERAPKRQRVVPPVRGQGSYERRKAPNACLVCRSRKTRCDNELPVCGFCKSTGGDCQYSKPPSARYDPASLAILQRLDTMDSRLVELLDKEKQRPPERLLQSGVSAVQNDSHIQSEGPPSSRVLLRANGDMSIEAMLKWPIYHPHIPRNSSDSGIRGHYDSLGIIDDDMFQLLWHEKPNLKQDEVNDLVESFISEILPSNPILDPVQLRMQAHDLVTCNSVLLYNGQSCLMLIILALGSITRRDLDQGDEDGVDMTRNHPYFVEAERYFRASQLRLPSLLRESDLLAAQCMFFTAVYLSFTMRIVAAWKAFAQAGTHCLAHLSWRGIIDQSVDSIRSPDSATTDFFEQRVRDDSLYWVILKGEAELCAELGMAGSALQESPYPHTFPNPPHLADMVASGYGQTLREATDRNYLMTGWFYYLGEIALKRLQNRVLEARYGEASAENTTTNRWEQSASDLLAQLDDWLRSLPPALQFAATSAEPLNDHLRWVLRGHRLDVIELLRFSAFKTVMLEPRVEDLSATTLSHAREYTDNAVLRIEAHVEEFLHRHQGTWLTIRGCTRSALALLGLKLRCDGLSSAGAAAASSFSSNTGFAQALLPPRWREAVVNVLEMLRAWSEERHDVKRLFNITEMLLQIC